MPQTEPRTGRHEPVERPNSTAEPGTGVDNMNRKEPRHRLAAWPFLALTAGLLALSAMAGWAGLAFMAALLGLGMASHAIAGVYRSQSHRPEGVGPAIRVLETVRRYIANEDPPRTTLSRVD
jgi:hypothetical protein